MLFTTVVFACGFLPIVLLGFFCIGRLSPSFAATWLFLASIFFYGYWMPEFTFLLLASICLNYFFGLRIAALANNGLKLGKPKARRWLIAGISLNLVALGYFKYANFFVANLNATLGFDWQFGRVVLPIGISFFTFTQIAFLADAWQKGVKEYKFVHFGLFVTYFPHLIAGPVLHHAQMMPQFRAASTYRFDSANFVAGLTIFALGLIKKIVLADGVAVYADPVFKAADSGVSPDFYESWLAAWAYTFQLYFDFSGYSDMAIGLSWMLNVRLPFNFNSPYKATSISDFWRRWHMTLSQFLRDYLYIALGGNRQGTFRRYSNLMTTMVLGGLWHGASWSFVAWGFLHGLYLVINHGYNALLGTVMQARLAGNPAYRAIAWLVTILAVVVAWVVFRAETLSGAGRILAGMARPAFELQVHVLMWNAGLQLSSGAIWCSTLAAIAFLAPNSNRIGELLLRVCHAQPLSRALIGGASLAAIAFLLLLNLTRDSVSAFIYFNF